MPYTTPFLPLTVSASVTSPSVILAHSEQHSRQPPQRTEASTGALLTTSDERAAPAAQASTLKAPPAAKTASRRSTLTSRFPLLRKGSRETSSAAHLRGSSVSSTAPPSQPDSPFLSTGAPRASSSSSRGRIDREQEEPRVRESSTQPSIRSQTHEAGETTSIHSATTPLGSPPSTTSINNGSPDIEPAEHQQNQKRLSIASTGTAKPADKKMHQTSSRLLRMTDDERPFTKDFKDLFATLMVSLPLTPHRVRFRMIDYTFTSDEAITNLGSLKFSQSNRMPDPKDSSRVVTTTTTTTFSMAKEMARSVCSKFLEAKFIESVEGKLDFQNKSSVWQLTPKGIHVLDRFCARNGIQSAHVKAVIESARNPHQLVVLERNTETDKLHHDEQTVEIIFRRFVGLTANEVPASDSDSIHEFSKCDVGVRLVKHKPTASRPYEYTFNGRNAAEWLMDCSTMVDRREALEVGSLFLQLKLIGPVDSRASDTQFIANKQAHYYITPHGERVAGWTIGDDASASAESGATKSRDGAARDSNSNRTNVIIRNPSWRLLYREFLKETMCEENLSFYLEVQEFNTQYRAAVNASGDNKIETIRETLAAAYGLYNAFLAPGSPNELNIDHGLRTQLATRMTRAVGDDNSMMQSLVEVATLFEKAQNSIFKLMSSDSVPKFIKHPKYAPQLKGLDAAAASAYAAQSTGSSRS